MPVLGLEYADYINQASLIDDYALYEQWQSDLAKKNFNDRQLAQLGKVFSFGAVASRAAQYGIVVQLCDACHSMMYTRRATPAYMGAQSVCNFCRNHYYEWCDECKTLIMNDDDLHTVHGDEYKHQLISKNDVISWKDDIMHHKRGYFAAGWERNQRNWRYFGVELEVERDSLDQAIPPDLILKSQQLFTDPDFSIAQHDGSLSSLPGIEKNGSNGFEIVTLPGTLGYHEHEAGWTRMLGGIGKWLQKRPSTTGLHVHVGSQGISKLTIGKVVVFANYFKNQDFMEFIADRPLNIPSPVNGKVYTEVRVGGSSDYKEWASERLGEMVAHRNHRGDCWHTRANKDYFNYFGVDSNGRPMYDNRGNLVIATLDPPKYRRGLPCHCPPGVYLELHPEDKMKLRRYEAVNICTEKNTFEFRIFRGKPDADYIFSCLEFCDALVDFCDMRKITELNYTAFLVWIEKRRRQYPFLVARLSEGGWIKSRMRRVDR